MIEDVCWILTDGKMGMVAQARGLAEAVGLPIVEKTLRGGFPWRFLPASLWPPGVMGLSPRSDSLTPPWPRLTISCGRHGVGPALEVKRRSGGRTTAVHIQHPRIRPSRFDLVVAAAHDRLSGPNVEVTAGSVHRVTRARLDEEAGIWADRLSAIPHPRIAVLIGGNNGIYQLGKPETHAIAEALDRLAKETGGGLMVTPSRRTGDENTAILREVLSGSGRIVWDLTGENPYFGFLGSAGAVIATGDSVNMVSEAVATGKPVHILDLPHNGKAAKFERFHKAMRDAGATRPFQGKLETWQVPEVDDTARAAARVRSILGL